MTKPSSPPTEASHATASAPPNSPASASSSTLNHATSATGSSGWVFGFVLLAAIWGASFMFTRASGKAFGALPTAGLRVFIASLFLLPILIWRGQLGALRKHWKMCFAVGVLNSAIPFGCLAWALLSIPTGISALLNATVPLFGAAIAWWWLGDRLQGSRVLGLVVGFVGVALLAFSKDTAHTGGGEASTLAVLACLCACFFYGIAASFTRRFLAGVPSLALATGSQLGASLVLLPLMVWTWPSQPAPPEAWGAVTALGILCTGLAYVLFFRLIEQTGPSKALSVTYAIPVFAILYGVLLLGESLTLWMGLCGAIIMLGTSLSTGLLAWGKAPAEK
jgi:drug/metabolite transporter (DMT)-like permease